MTYKKSSFQNSISNFSDVITYRQMKNFNDYNFLYDLNNTCMYHHDETVSVNSYVDTFTNNFILTLDKHAPTNLNRIKIKLNQNGLMTISKNVYSLGIRKDAREI